MAEYKTGIKYIDWQQLYELYKPFDLLNGMPNQGKYDEIQKAFRNSAKVVTAWDGNTLVGCGRLISDGVCYAYIHDVAVRKDLHGKGIGKGIMLELMKGWEHVCIYLTANFGTEPFYRKLGFKKHKTAFAKYPYESEYLEG